MTYEYFAKVRHADTVERPSALYRRDGGQREYLSLLNWKWHPVAPPMHWPHENTLVPVDAETVARLLADRQRFARYWIEPRSDEPLPGSARRTETFVYRRLSSPERLVDEVFAPWNEWTTTDKIFDYLSPRSSAQPLLIPADRDTVERILQQERGITGATEL